MAGYFYNTVLGVEFIFSQSLLPEGFVAQIASVTIRDNTLVKVAKSVGHWKYSGYHSC